MPLPIKLFIGYVVSSIPASLIIGRLFKWANLADRYKFAAETEGERSAAVPAPGFRPPGAGASTPGGES
jgi:hypothetical protein